MSIQRLPSQRLPSQRLPSPTLKCLVCDLMSSQWLPSPTLKCLVRDLMSSQWPSNNLKILRWLPSPTLMCIVSDLMRLHWLPSPTLTRSSGLMETSGLKVTNLTGLLCSLTVSRLINSLSLRVLISRLRRTIMLSFQSRTVRKLSLRFQSPTMRNQTAKFTTTAALKVTAGLRWPTWAIRLMMRSQNRLSSTPSTLYDRCTEHHLKPHLTWLKRANAESKIYEFKKITLYCKTPLNPQLFFFLLWIIIIKFGLNF